MRALPIFGEGKSRSNGAVACRCHRQSGDSNLLPFEKTNPRQEKVCANLPFNFVGSLGTIIQLFSGCQLNTLRRALRLLLRELRLNDLQLQDGSVRTAQLMVVECQHGSKCQRVSLQRLQFFTCQKFDFVKQTKPLHKMAGFPDLY